MTQPYSSCSRDDDTVPNQATRLRAWRWLSGKVHQQIHSVVQTDIRAGDRIDQGQRLEWLAGTCPPRVQEAHPKEQRYRDGAAWRTNLLQAALRSFDLRIERLPCRPFLRQRPYRG